MTNVASFDLWTAFLAHWIPPNCKLSCDVKQTCSAGLDLEMSNAVTGNNRTAESKAPVIIFYNVDHLCAFCPSSTKCYTCPLSPDAPVSWFLTSLCPDTGWVSQSAKSLWNNLNMCKYHFCCFVLNWVKSVNFLGGFQNENLSCS